MNGLINDLNYEEFISKPKSLLIAPAGYGKTFSLAKCIEYTKGKSLILTHTHAGIASIKEKLINLNIPSKKYNIATITGYAQKYMLAFYNEKNIPAITNGNYFEFVISKTSELFKYKPIKKIIKSSYNNLFVDEYQDCTINLHNMIMLLADILPTHIFGDPLQGIFDFKDKLIDFETNLTDFNENIVKLNIPYRWINNGNNKDLGGTFVKIRKCLESENKIINLNNYDAIKSILIKENDIFKKNSDYYKKLSQIINNKDYNNLLIIVPEYKNEKNIPQGTIKNRARLKSFYDYSGKLFLLTAIDEKDSYLLSENADTLIATKNKNAITYNKIKTSILDKLFIKKNLNEYIKNNNLISKRNPKKKLVSDELKKQLDNFINNPSPKSLLSLIKFMKNTKKFKPQRIDLLYNFIKAIEISNNECKSIYEGMVSYKNMIRKIGKKIDGKCIGTTLLTKGLEFDTVVILDAHRFIDHKNFYVAITRACKNLFVFSEKNILDFNK